VQRICDTYTQMIAVNACNRAIESASRIADRRQPFTKSPRRVKRFIFGCRARLYRSAV
jgi:hypothetical protein